MLNGQSNTKLYGLLDGAQYRETLAPFVLEFSPEVRSLFEGLPEEKAGSAAPILFEIDDINANWVRDIDEMDRYRPCLTVIRSSLKIDALWAHLRAFLFADIGGGMTVLVRFYDPRLLPAVLDVWGQEVRTQLTHPLESWLYRGHFAEWQHVEIVEHEAIPQTEPPSLVLTQRQLDALEQRDEPFAIISEMVPITEAVTYASRYRDFMNRYHRATQWGLSSRADREAYCACSYDYGHHFDQHPLVREAISASIRAAQSTQELSDRFDAIPDRVWAQIRDTSISDESQRESRDAPASKESISNE